jgi:hypothetical protein
MDGHNPSGLRMRLPILMVLLILGFALGWMLRPKLDKHMVVVDDADRVPYQRQAGGSPKNAYGGTTPFGATYGGPDATLRAAQ